VKNMPILILYVVSFCLACKSDNNMFLFQTCPLCLKKMSSAIIDVHANMCASEMFGD
jgi:hypothetical protein